MSQKDEYKLGLVGCGTISGTHAEAIANSELGTLIAAHSRTKANLDAFCEQYDVRGYSDYDQFLESDIDIVVICTPTGTHLDFGLKAAEAGKHLIIEKPIEVTLERGQRLIRASEENDVKLAVIFQNRFIDEVQKMKAVLDEGQIGKPVMVDASVKWFRDQEYYDSAGWRGTLSLDGGGALINQAVHTVDLMLWLCGDVESVKAYTGTLTHERMEGEDNAVSAIRFESGALGVFKASTSIVPAQSRKIEVHCEQGTAVLDGDTFSVSGESSGDNRQAEKAKSTGAANPMEGMTGSNHQKQYEQILTAFYEDREPVVSGNDSLKSLAFVRAVYESAEQQQAVNLKEFIDF